VTIVGIIVGILGNSNYDEVSTARDQRNLQLSLDDCKRLFVEGDERDNCFEKSILVFGSDEQIHQWELRHYQP
jgi:hypothetical protein